MESAWTLNGCYPLIMADETKDGKDLPGTNYHYNGAKQESFLHLESTENLDAAGLGKKKVSTFWKATVWDTQRTCLDKHMTGLCHEWQAFWGEVFNISEQCGATLPAAKRQKQTNKNKTKHLL